MEQKNALPVFMQDKKTNEIMRTAIRAIPKNTKMYLVGGTMRIALFYNLFGKKLPSRDYDSVLIGNHKKFISNMRSSGFTYGFIRRKSHTTLKKKKSW